MPSFILVQQQGASISAACFVGHLAYVPQQQGAAELGRPLLFCIGKLVALLEVRLAVINTLVSVTMFTLGVLGALGASMTSVAISASGASGAFSAKFRHGSALPRQSV